MLSQGTYHQHVPTDPVANVAFRARLLERATGDPAFQAAILDFCREDILFFINVFVWQYNPLKKGKDAYGPFICWPFQEAALLARPEKPYRGGDFGLKWEIAKGLLWCYENNRSAVVEKSRELGASWLFLILQDWLCICFNDVQCLDISRNADTVDSKTRNSLFSKIRYMHACLPEFLTQGPVVQQKMYFEFACGSEVTGEASTGKAGVSGRASVIFVDEVAHIEDALEVRQRTANTSDCRFFNSTHLGTGNEFYRITQTPEFVKIQMHWIMHPEKVRGAYRVVDGKVEVLDKHYQYPEGYVFVTDGRPVGGPYPGVRSPYYDRKAAEIGTERGAATELDINPAGSVSQFYEPLVIRSLIAEHARVPRFQGDVAFDKDTGKFLGFIPRQGGPLRLWSCLTLNKTPAPASYTAGADLAWGTGTTPSCLSIMNADIGEKVLEYVSRSIKPQDFALVCAALCWLFEDEYGVPAYFVWEMQGPASTFWTRLKEIGFTNVYYRKNELADFPENASNEPGWYPRKQTKMKLHGDYAAALLGRQYVNPSEHALNEALRFQLNPGGDDVFHSGQESEDDPFGAGVNHGDIVIADALSFMLAQSRGLKRLAPKEQRTIPEGSLAFRRQLRENKHRQEAQWAG